VPSEAKEEEAHIEAIVLRLDEQSVGNGIRTAE